MKLGVVIPTLDEAEAIEVTLRSVGRSGPGDDISEPVLTEPAIEGPLFEGGPEIMVIVADGGSRDDTCQRARRLGAEMAAEARARGGRLDIRVIGPAEGVEPGRARQLQAGFEACGGDAVLFLHADTKLPEGWAADVRHALADPDVVGGAFRFEFDREEPMTLGLRIIEWGARMRVAVFGLPYGDQAIFARRSAVDAVGGVPQVPIMEDLDLVTALKQHGRLASLHAPATTSSRRYLARGVLRTFLKNWAALTAWRLGIDRPRVAAWYRA